MVRAERNEYRASAIDERDVQVLLLLLEHKVLTTHQLTSLCFRSLRRCQHRMRELKDLGLISSFQVGRGFGEGRAPACWHLTKPGLVEIADAKSVRVSDLPWVPDSSYRTNLVLAHRLGVNAYFCALAEASRAFQGHCLATWRPEHSVRTRAAEVKPDGFGRYLHPDGASEFYIEYDRATEARGALTRAHGVPEPARARPGGGARGRGRHRLPLVDYEPPRVGFARELVPLYVASEDRLTEVGVLGPAWKHVPTHGDCLPLVDLPTRARDLYRTARCLGRYFTDADPGHRRRIAPASATSRFRALPPRHAP